MAGAEQVFKLSVLGEHLQQMCDIAEFSYLFLPGISQFLGLLRDALGQCYELFIKSSIKENLVCFRVLFLK